MNTSVSAGYSNDPHIQFLSQVLADIESGHLLVPRFQRPRVWGIDRRLELLRSIREGIPVGSIMIWRTRSRPIQCYDRIGPYPLNIRKDVVPHQYILDGVQRLSTLFGALKPQPANAPEEEEETYESEDEEEGVFQRTYFDLDDEEFFESGEANVEESALPLDILFESVALLRFQRQLQHSNAETWIQRADALAKAFREYKIPIIPITTDSLELATRTFKRINSQGAAMSDFHMLHALTWSNNFDLQRRLQVSKDETLAPLGWRELDEDPILKTCKAALGVDIYKVEAEHLSEKIKHRPAVVHEAVSNIAKAATFFKNTCRAGNPDTVPYSLHIVFVAEAFRVCPNGEQDESLVQLLTDWFWLTSYTEAFTGISDDRVRVGLEDIRHMANTKEARWRLLPAATVFSPRKRFDYRSARSKALALTLARLRDQVNPGQGTELLAEYDRRAVVQVIPSQSFKKNRAMYSSPGNRFLIAPNELSLLRQKLAPSHLDETIEGIHGIPAQAREELSKGNVERFVHIRAQHLHEIESSVLEQVFRRFAPGAPLTIDFGAPYLRNIVQTLVAPNRNN